MYQNLRDFEKFTRIVKFMRSRKLQYTLQHFHLVLNYLHPRMKMVVQTEHDKLLPSKVKYITNSCINNNHVMETWLSRYV